MNDIHALALQQSDVPRHFRKKFPKLIPIGSTHRMDDDRDGKLLQPLRQIARFGAQDDRIESPSIEG